MIRFGGTSVGALAGDNVKGLVDGRPFKIKSPKEFDENLSALFSTVSDGDVVYIPAGSYFITSPIRITASRVHIIAAPGVVIDATGLPELEYAFKFEGSEGEAMFLATNASAGSTTVTVPSTSEFSVGDVVVLRSDATFENTGLPFYELHEIISIDTENNVLTLSGPLRFTYETTANARIAKVNAVEDVHVEGLHIILSPTLRQNGIRFRYARRAKVSKNRIINAFQRAVDFRYCYDFECSSNYILHVWDEHTSQGQQYTGQGYGVCVDASRYGLVHHNTLIDAKHAVSHGNMSEDVSIESNIVLRCRLQGLDAHETDRNIRFVNNIVKGRGSLSGPGIWVRCDDVEVVDNLITDVGHGIIVQPGDATVRIQQRNVLISRNRIKASGRAITNANNFSIDSYNFRIENNEIYEGSYIGIECDKLHESVVAGNIVRKASTQGILVKNSVNVRITDNEVSDCGSGGSHYDGIRVDASQNVHITNNRAIDKQATRTQRHGIYIGPECSHVVLDGNLMNGNRDGALYANVNVTFGTNEGYTTKNFGQATIAATSTSVAVNHGLGNRDTNPIKVVVTPATSLGSATRFWVSNITSTSFTINVDVAPGGAGATFYWMAEK